MARAGQNVPEEGPPWQWPLELPGTDVHIQASAWGNPVLVVGIGPSPRPGGLQSTSLPFLRRLCGRSGPFPFWAVLTMKCAPCVLAETLFAQRTSSIVQFRWVSLVKKPRILPTPIALRTRAV